MKTLMAKALLAAMMALAMGAVSTSAIAFPIFQVTETSVPGTTANTITADRIIGGYTEVGTFNTAAPCGGTNVCGSFDASIAWNASDYFNGATSQSNQLGSLFTQQYGLYALFQATGNYVTDTLTGKTTFHMAPGGSLGLWIDPLSDTTFAAPGTGSGAWTLGSIADDYMVASGTPASGTGNLDPTLSTCTGGGINCGSFGVASWFYLTDYGTAQDGQSYFTSPVPFYNVNFTSGQFDNFSPTGTQSIHGSLDATFSVPEPESLALLGIGLLGLAMSRRARNKQVA